MGSKKDKKMSISEIKKLSPLLRDLNSFDWYRHEVHFCRICLKKVTHETYRGHTFAEGSFLMLCLKCGHRWLR